MGRSCAAAMAAGRLAIDLSLKFGQLAELLGGEGEDVAGVVDELPVEQLAGRALAQVLDVHGAAGGEVDDAPQHLRGAVQVRAAGDGLVLGADDRLPQTGQFVGMTNARSVPVAQAGDGRHDLGDDLARAAHDDGVADQHALARDLVARCAASPSRW